MIAPKLVDGTKRTGVNTIKVDVDKFQDLSAKYQISAMPTFKILDNTGKELGSLTGANVAKVNELFDKAKSFL